MSPSGKPSRPTARPGNRTTALRGCAAFRPRWTPAALGLLGLTLASTAAAGSIHFDQPLRQGSLVTGTATEAPVTVDGRRIRRGSGGEIVFGLGRDQQEVRVCMGSGAAQACQSHAVESGQWRIERVDGLPPKTVTPDPATAARIAEEAALVVEARKQDSPGQAFLGPWQQPASGRISGVYGSQRILNGVPGSTHLGLDIAAPKGDPVLAAADGTVSLVHQDMVLSGKTVLIDHGHGVSTVYIHMSQIQVELGQRVKAGQRIGSIGASGRASGPHLHWGLNWFDVKLDPQQLPLSDPPRQ